MFKKLKQYILIKRTQRRLKKARNVSDLAQLANDMLQNALKSLNYAQGGENHEE